MTEDNFERWITAGDDLGGDGWGWVTAGIALDKEFLPQEVAASMNFSVNPCDNFYGEAIRIDLLCSASFVYYEKIK
jgi:hypothetical protein